MGLPKPPLDVKLIAAIAFKETVMLEETKRRLQELFSPIDLESEIYEFKHTQYYINSNIL